MQISISNLISRPNPTGIPSPPSPPPYVATKCVATPGSSGVIYNTNKAITLEANSSEEFILSSWVKWGQLTSRATVYALTMDANFSSSTPNCTVFLGASTTAMKVTIFGEITPGAGATFVTYSFTSSGMTAGTWYNIGLSYAPGFMSVFVDGVSLGLQTAVTAPLTLSFTNPGSLSYIGNIGTSAPYTMDYDDTAWFQQKITTQSQAVELYNNGCPSDLTQVSFAHSLSHYWKWGDGINIFGGGVPDDYNPTGTSQFYVYDQKGTNMYMEGIGATTSPMSTNVPCP